jgi:XTP/dITP diphosphohydrolase/tetrapyrrole methylase family protein/MazG family protein/ATP diphosphatase
VAPRLPPAPCPPPAQRRPPARPRRPLRRLPRPAAELDLGLGALERLDEITRRLRRECPWDREQDERSIVPHTVEEAYELADAAQRGDDEKLRDELGDVLFQVVFLALLLEERGAGSLSAVAEELTAKLIRRHPHVFGDAEAETAGEVLRNWDTIKREVEGRGAEDPFADIPENLPGLLYARKTLRRADPEGGAPANRETRDEAEAAVGEMLLEAVRLSRRLGVDPELAVRAAADRLRERSR